MFLKSEWNLSLCLSVLLLTWTSSAAFVLPGSEFALIEADAQDVPSPKDLTPLLTKLKENVNEIEAAANHNLLVHNSLLMQVILKTTNEIGSLKKAEIDNQLSLKISEKLQSQLTANTAAIADLKSQMENLMPANVDAHVHFMSIIKDLNDRNSVVLAGSQINPVTESQNEDESSDPFDEIMSEEDGFNFLSRDF